MSICDDGWKCPALRFVNCSKTAMRQDCIRPKNLPGAGQGLYSCGFDLFPPCSFDSERPDSCPHAEAFKAVIENPELVLAALGRRKNPCPRCGGVGKLRFTLEDGRRFFRNCSTCNGTGEAGDERIARGEF